MRFIFSRPDRPEIIEGMCRWAGPLIGDSFDPEHTAGISVLCEHGAATVLYDGYKRGISINMHVAGTGHWLSRTALDVFFSYPFIDLGVRRVNGFVAKKNKKARTLNEKLGFVREGCLRQAAYNGDGLIVYGMLRKDCRWLKDEEDGRKVEQSA